jgi:hypothetical protein
MKDEKDDDLDKIFQEGLRDPVEPIYREQDWNALEQMFGRSKKRAGALFWLPILSSAALILIVAGWWFLKPRPAHFLVPKQQQELADQRKKKIDTFHNIMTQHKPNVKIGTTGLLAAQSSGTGINVLSQPGVDTKRIGAYPDPDNSSAGITRESKGDFAITAVSLGVNENSGGDLPGNAASNISPAHLTTAMPGGITPKPKITTQTGLKANPRYALNVLGAPELNAVNSLQQTRSGTNMGLLFSVGLFSKLTISTGAQYSNKPYNSYFTNDYVKPFNSDLTSINASCRVLDIPLNLDYQFFGNYRNKFSIGTGLSSYIMLHESYVYNYSNPTVNGPVSYTVPYSNKYLFDILNLQATYTRQVNSKAGVTFTPYLKLPLTGIGANQARLQTTGIALGLVWNINSPYKP